MANQLDSKGKKSNELTSKQLMFCMEYLKDLNATQAAIRAGYSEKVARQQAYENLTKPYIHEKIQELMGKREDRIERSADDVVKMLWDMMLLDLKAYITVSEGGEIQSIPFDQLPEGATKLISKIKEKTRITESSDGSRMFKNSQLEYELPEKTKLIELLLKHYGLLKEKHEHSAKITEVQEYSPEVMEMANEFLDQWYAKRGRKRS